MKTTAFIIAATTALAAAEEVIPSAFPKARYEETVTKSPFALATPPVEVEKEEEDPGKDMHVTGLGTDYVVIQKLGEDKSTRFFGKEKPDGEDMFVERIIWSEEIGKSEVEVNKGGKKFRVKYNQNLLNGGPQQPGPSGAVGGPAGGQRPPGMGNIPRPGSPGFPGGNVPNAPGMVPKPGGGVNPQINSITPTLKTTQPTITTVPRPGGTNIQPQSTSGDNSAPNRRIRVINNDNSGGPSGPSSGGRGGPSSGRGR